MAILPLLVLVLPLPLPPGPESALRIGAWIEALGDPDIRLRDRAYQELLHALPWAEKELRQNQVRPDAEIASRCRSLISLVDQARSPKWVRAGRIALVDFRGDRIATDIRSRDRIQVGERVRVTRQGQKIGFLVIEDVQVWGSWAAPDVGTTADLLEKGDTVERLIPPGGR